MQTYLKTRPVWIQLLLYIGMAAGIATVIFTAGIFIVSAVTGMSAVEIADAASWEPGDTRVIAALRGLMLLQFLGLFLIPALLFAYFSDPRPAHYLGLKKPWSPVYWLIAIIILLVAIPLVQYSGDLNRQIPFGGSTLRWIKEMEDEASKTLQIILGSDKVGDLLLNYIFIAAFAAIGEELVFRGILQRLLIRVFKNPWAGIILAALLFSAFHMQFFGFIPRFLLGIVLGALYWYSGSLWTAILAHFVYDAVVLTIAFNSPELVSNPDAKMIDSSAVWIMALVSTGLVAFLMWVMKKNSRTDFDEIYAGDKPVEENQTAS